MPPKSKRGKKAQSSKQRKGSSSVEPPPDDARASSLQSRANKHVHITETPEDFKEGELSDDAAAVQDMDAAAEASEMALSEAEGGLDGDKKVDDVVMVILSEATQRRLGCVVGENLFVDKTWCSVSKKAILEEISDPKTVSPFFSYAKNIEAYTEDEFLIGYTPFEEVQNRFLFCVTVQGKMSILDRLQNLRVEFLERITKLKSVKPGVWQSQGSEKEVEAANVHYERPLLSFEWLTKLSLRNTGHPTFSDMVAGEDKSSVVHCLPNAKSLKELNLVVRKSQDVAVQAVTPTAKKSVQTIPQIPTNVAVQCVSQTDITEEAKKHSPAITDDQLNSLFSNYREYLLKALRYNELYDLYQDDYSTLSKLGSKFLPAPIDNYKQYQSFTDVGAIEGKLIVSVTWSPKYTGIFAVAYADEVPCKWKELESDSDDPDYEVDKEENQETTKLEQNMNRTKEVEQRRASGEAEWLENEKMEEAWKKDRGDMNSSAYSKAQAKLKQMQLARITQVFQLEEYKEMMRRKTKYSEHWIEEKYKKEENLRKKQLKRNKKKSRLTSIKQGTVNKSPSDRNENEREPQQIMPEDESSEQAGEQLTLKKEESDHEMEDAQNAKLPERYSTDREWPGGKGSGRVSLRISSIHKKREKMRKDNKKVMKIMKRRLRDEIAWKSRIQNYNYVFYKSALTKDMDTLKVDSDDDITSKNIKRAGSMTRVASGSSLTRIRSRDLFNPYVQIQKMDDYGMNLSRMKIRKEIFKKYKQDRKLRKSGDAKSEEMIKKRSSADLIEDTTNLEGKKPILRETPSLTTIWGPEECWEYGTTLREAVRRLHRHHKKVRKQVHKKIRPMFTPIQWPEKTMNGNQRKEEGFSELGDLRENSSTCLTTSSGSDESYPTSQSKRDRDKVAFQSRKLVEEYEEITDENERKEAAEVLPMLIPNNPVLIWSFNDDLAPKLRLDCPYELSCIQFCPQNGDIIAGATASGQVVIWDITGRLEAVESAASEPSEENRHRKQLINNMGLGVPVPVGTFSYQFATTGICGSILFWDLRSTPYIKKKLKKPHEMISSQIYDPFPESPFASLNNAWKPFLKIQLPESNGSSEMLTGLSVDQPPAKYVPKDQIPIHMEDRVEYILVHSSIDKYSNQINIGTRYGRVGILKVNGVTPGTDELEFVQKWYDLAHDGPVTGVFQHPFFPQLTITAGGHIFAIWHSEFEDYPIMWRRYRKVRVTACLWSTLRPSLFRIARDDGTVEIWDLLRQSNRCQREIIVSGQIVTTIAGGPLPLPRGLLGIADYNSTMRMFYIPWQYQVWTEEERLRMEEMVNKEPGRLRRMHEWRKWFNETQSNKIKKEKKVEKLDEDTKESEDGEIQQKAQIRKKYNEEVYKWYVKRRGRNLTKFEIEAKEKLESRERAHMLNMVMARKKVDRQRMEKLMHPLVRMEKLEMEREEKAQRRLKEADALFKAAVQKLFPSSPEMNSEFESLDSEEELAGLTSELYDLFGKNWQQLQKEAIDALLQWNWECNILTDKFYSEHRAMREVLNSNSLVLKKFKWLKQKLLKQLVEEGHRILIPKSRKELFIEWKYEQREENLDELKELYGFNYDPHWDRSVTCTRMRDRRKMLSGEEEIVGQEEEKEEDIEGERQLSVLDSMPEVRGSLELEEVSIKGSTAEDEPIKSVLEKMSAMTEGEPIDELDLDEQVLLMTRQSSLLPILPSPTGFSWLSLEVQDDLPSAESDFKPELDTTPHTFVPQQTKSLKQQKVVQQSVAIDLSAADLSDEEEEYEDDEESREQESASQNISVGDSKQNEVNETMRISIKESETVLEKTPGQSSSIAKTEQKSFELGLGEQSRDSTIKEMFSEKEVEKEDEISSQID